MSTLATLVTRVREKVDEATAAFWTDTVIESQLNESYRYYWAFILKLHEGYFNTTENISFDANADGLYDLASDSFKIRLVSRLLTNQKVPLTYRERFDTPIAKTTSDTNYLPTYRYRGKQILFEPAPDFSEANAIEIEYTATLADLSATQDVDTGFPAIGEDCVVLRATAKCKGIEEMVAGGGVDRDPFLLDLATTEQTLKEAVEQRTRARIYVEPFGIYDGSYY